MLRYAATFLHLSKLPYLHIQKITSCSTGGLKVTLTFDLSLNFVLFKDQCNIANYILGSAITITDWSLIHDYDTTKQVRPPWQLYYKQWFSFKLVWVQTSESAPTSNTFFSSSNRSGVVLNEGLFPLLNGWDQCSLLQVVVSPLKAALIAPCPAWHGRQVACLWVLCV